MYEVDLFDVSVSTSWFILIGTNWLFLKDFKVAGSTLGRGAWAAWEDHSEKDELRSPGWWLCHAVPSCCHGEEQTHTGSQRRCWVSTEGCGPTPQQQFTSVCCVLPEKHPKQEEHARCYVWFVSAVMFPKSHWIINIKKLRKILRNICKPLHFADISVLSARVALWDGMSPLPALRN